MVEKMWNVGVSILMPARTVIVDAETEEDAIEQAIRILNEACLIPEHAACDVHVEEI
jgi:hypothetical protein